MLVDVLHPDNQKHFPNEAPKDEQEAQRMRQISEAMTAMRKRFFSLLKENDLIMTKVIENRSFQRRNRSISNYLALEIVKQAEQDPELNESAFSQLPHSQKMEVIMMLLSDISAKFPYNEREERFNNDESLN